MLFPVSLTAPPNKRPSNFIKLIQSRYQYSDGTHRMYWNRCENRLCKRDSPCQAQESPFPSCKFRLHSLNYFPKHLFINSFLQHRHAQVLSQLFYHLFFIALCLREISNYKLGAINYFHKHEIAFHMDLQTMRLLHYIYLNDYPTSSE